MFKVIYIDQNTINKRYPNSPVDGDKFFTYGWQSQLARKFKSYNPDVEVECWKADSRIRDIYSRNIENVRYIVFPSIMIYRIGNYSHKLINYLVKELKSNSRVIFNVGSIRHLLFYSIAIRLKHFPLVVQHHGESSAIHRAKISRGLKKLFYIFQIPVEITCFKNVDAFLVVDKRIKNYLPKNNNTLIEFSTVGNDEIIFHPIDKKLAKQMLGWEQEKKHILYVGKLNYTKRPDILINLFNELKKEGRDNISLVLAGNSKDDPFYEEAVRSGAKLYPIINQKELYKYLSAADVYCLPQYSQEHQFAGVGTLPIEALLCETPIIGENLQSFPEEDREKVGYISRNEKELKLNIIKILENKSNFNDLRNIALKHYNWENISKRTREIYLNLLTKYYG